MKPAPRSGFWRPERLACRLAGKAGAAWADQRGVAAIEFGIFFILLAASLANVADVSKYIFQRMEVENATEVAAQAAFAACGQPQPPYLPATTKCSNLMAAINAALQSTSLGTDVQLANNPPVEAYYCINSANALQNVGSVTSPKPSDCMVAGTPTLAPGDYIQIQTKFTYQPWFPGFSVASFFPTSINRTAMMRLG